MRFFCSLVSIIFVFNLNFSKSGDLFDGYESKVTLYLLSSSSCCQIIEVEKEEVKNFKDEIKGLSLSNVDGGFVDKKLKAFNCKKAFEEKGENFSSVYYYSPKIPAYKLINGQKVNFHVAKTNDGFVIGIPLIFGAF